MKKQDLYDFIESRSKKRQKELVDVYQVKADKYADDLLSWYRKDLEKISTITKQLQENVDTVQELSGLHPYNTYTNFLVDIASKGSYKEAVEKSVRSNFSYLRNQRVHGHTPEPIAKIFKQYNQIVVEYQAKREEAHLLRTELDSIVKAFPSAKKAAVKLEELGLDLSGIEKVSVNNLPMVTKTSIDICVFNEKGC